jgi:hypothetical protein
MKVPSTTTLIFPTLSPLLTAGKNIVGYFLDSPRRGVLLSPIVAGFVSTTTRKKLLIGFHLLLVTTICISELATTKVCRLLFSESNWLQHVFGYDIDWL